MSVLFRLVDHTFLRRTPKLTLAFMFLLLACSWAAVPAKAQTCSSFNVSPLEIDFGTVRPGERVSEVVTVTPVGGSGSFTLSIQNQDPAPAFSVTPTSRTSSNPFQVTVYFQPNTSGGTSWFAELFINAGACGSTTINLFGENFGGQHNADPTELDFGTAAIGQSKTDTVTVSAGTDPAAPLRITATTNNPAISVNPATFQVDEDSPREVTVSYTPTVGNRLTGARVLLKAVFVGTNFPVPTDVTVDIDGLGFGIITTSLPDAGLGCSYSTLVKASGGFSPYTWAIATGSLPPGLTLDPIAGLISGTPTAGGRSNFSLRATDDQSVAHTRSLSITVGDPKPAISADGFLDAAGTEPPAVGGLASVYGAFCVDTGNAAQIPLPTEINGARVLLGPTAAALTSGNNADALLPAPLLFVSGQQINFQVPWELASSAPGFLQAVVEVDGVTSNPVQVAIARNTPSIFAFDFERPAKGVVLNLDNTAAQPSGSIPGYPSRPAARGGVIVIYANGLGPVTPPPETGGLGVARVLHDTVEKPVVRVGGTPATVSFSGLSPNFIGLYQVNATLAGSTPVGAAVPITLEIGGEQSPADVTIAVIGAAAVSQGAN